MENQEKPGQGSKAPANWLAIVGGCALSITILCALALVVLLMASAAFNVYLAWTLSGYQVSVGRPTSEPVALVMISPTGVLAIIPTPTSPHLPAATTGPTSTSTPPPTETPTQPPSPAPTQTRPKPQPATPTATTRLEESGSAGTEMRDLSADAPDQNPRHNLSNRPASETIPYVVQEGDTLWLIAATAYNAGRLWPVIFEANREVLDDPNHIQPGQVLRLPLNP
ncbi:MAG: hypothetical protein Kow0063_29020 [Anaerolineae bacterium]